jgi:hypothetical protein
MKISFFAEFPEEDLKGLKHLRREVKIYLAAEGVEQFREWEKKYKQSKKVKEVIYWPTLSREEGYWISPFSNRNGLERTFKEIDDEKKKVKVMIDSELPITRNPLLLLSQAANFLANSQRIRRFLKDHQGTYIAEHYPQSRLGERIMKLIGLSYSPKKYGCRTIKMCYHSMHRFEEEKLRKRLKKGVQKYGSSYLIGLGTVAKGVLGWERILSAEELERDLRIAREEGVAEAVVFRLGGMNEKYAKVVENQD